MEWVLLSSGSLRVIVLLLAVIFRAVIVFLLVIIAPLVIALASVRTNRHRQADGLVPEALAAAWARHRLQELADGDGQRDRLRHHPAPALQLGTVCEGAALVKRRHCPGGGLILRTARATVGISRRRRHGLHSLHRVHGLHALHRGTLPSELEDR